MGIGMFGWAADKLSEASEKMMLADEVVRLTQKALEKFPDEWESLTVIMGRPRKRLHKKGVKQLEIAKGLFALSNNLYVLKDMEGEGYTVFDFSGMNARVVYPHATTYSELSRSEIQHFITLLDRFFVVRGR